MSSNSSGRGFRSVWWLASQQIVSRVFTFLLNVYVARQVGPGVYGLATIHFLLPYTILLFLAREPIRRSTLRFSAASSSSSSSTFTENSVEFVRKNVVNVSWIFFGLSLPLFFLLLAIFVIFSTPTYLSDTDYRRLMFLFLVCGQLELLAESGYIILQKCYLLQIRMMIETGSVLMKCLATIVSLIAISNTQFSAAYAFAIGQMTYSACIVFFHFSYFFWTLHQRRKSKNPKDSSTVVDTESDELLGMTSMSDLFPHRLSLSSSSSTNPAVRHNFIVSCFSSYISPSFFSLTFSFAFQSIEKLILSEGEKFIFVFISPSTYEAAGVYSLVQNLGSLIVRFLFQPLEESAYLEWAQTIGKQKDDENNSALGNQRKIDENVVNESIRSLSILLKFVIYLSLFFICLGCNYSSLFFHIFYGSNWSSDSTAASSTLNVYFFYLLFLAINGLTEAYLMSSIKSEQLHQYNYLLIFFSGIYLGFSAILLPRYGATGIILANCLNMAARILFSYFYIQKFQNKHCATQKQQKLVFGPRPLLAIVFVAAFVCTYFSQQFFFQSISFTQTTTRKEILLAAVSHIGVGVLALAGILGCAWKLEKKFLKDLRELLSARKKKKDE